MSCFGTFARKRVAAGNATRVLALAAGLCATATTVAAHDAGATPKEESQYEHSLLDQATRSKADYAIPQIKLVRADGKTVWLADEINDGRPVVMDFIYTTCTSICPVSSQTLAGLQTKLGAASSAVHLVSISIDPENDTPDRLRQYARKFGAGPAWNYYTGTLAASNAAQHAFDVYRGDKMSHTPVTLIRAAPGQSWVRIDGFATPDQLFSELREVVSARASAPRAIASHTTASHPLTTN